MAQVFWNCVVQLDDHGWVTLINWASLSTDCPSWSLTKEITLITVWTMGWPDLFTIMASRRTMRNHSGTKGFIQKIKDHIKCVWPSSILHKLLGTDQQSCCSKFWENFVTQHGLIMIRIDSGINKGWPDYHVAWLVTQAVIFHHNSLSLAKLVCMFHCPDSSIQIEISLIKNCMLRRITSSVSCPSGDKQTLFFVITVIL